MISNGLPTSENIHGINVKFKEIFGKQEFFLFSLDWGSARITDLIDKEKERLGLNYIRYDLPISSYSKNGWFRSMPKSGTKVHQDLESGKTFVNAVEGPTYVLINPVDFTIERGAVISEDWLGYTGQGLSGGVVWVLCNRHILNIARVYPAAMKAFGEFEVPEIYRKFRHLIGELILPYDTYPLTESYRRIMVKRP